MEHKKAMEGRCSEHPAPWTTGSGDIGWKEKGWQGIH